MFTTVIIEDEKPAARRLQRLLEKQGVFVEVMLHSIVESIDWLSTHPNPDLIFLDIQLSDGLSFEIFEKVKLSSAIIFTTAYDQYALKAFKLKSVDYLLKPIDVDELKEALHKFTDYFQSSVKTTIDIVEIKKLLQPKALEYKKRFMVQIGQHLKMIEVHQIECIYSENKSSYAYLTSSKTYLLDNSIEALTKELNPKVFFRVNRQFIINISAIRDIISYTNSRLQIKLNTYNQADIIVSRERVKDFKNWLAR